MDTTVPKAEFTYTMPTPPAAPTVAVVKPVVTKPGNDRKPQIKGKKKSSLIAITIGVIILILMNMGLIYLITSQSSEIKVEEPIRLSTPTPEITATVTVSTTVLPTVTISQTPVVTTQSVTKTVTPVVTENPNLTKTTETFTMIDVDDNKSIKMSAEIYKADVIDKNAVSGTVATIVFSHIGTKVQISFDAGPIATVMLDPITYTSKTLVQEKQTSLNKSPFSFAYEEDINIVKVPGKSVQYYSNVVNSSGCTGSDGSTAITAPCGEPYPKLHQNDQGLAFTVICTGSNTTYCNDVVKSLKIL